MYERREVTIVTCEDNKLYLKKLKRIIEQYTLKNNINARTKYFQEYDEDFFNVMNESIANRIYILDIETPLGSGKDVARLIRKFDHHSIIIFISNYRDMADSVAMDLLNVLTFISKLDDCENHLKRALQEAMIILGETSRFEFKQEGDTYYINRHDILYITYDSKTRKSNIVTSKTIYHADLKLKDCLMLLGPSFQYSHRSCIVNLDRILCYNKERIKFDNGKTTNLISKKFFEEKKTFA